MSKKTNAGYEGHLAAAKVLKQGKVGKLVEVTRREEQDGKRKE